MASFKEKDEGGRRKDERPLKENTFRSIQSLGVGSDAKLLVAVSGGPDSLALAHVLHSLREMGLIGSLAVAHVNHKLRGAASNRDEESVRRYCEAWNIPFHLKRDDTLLISEIEKTGIEETARKLRYIFFEELVETFGFDFALTAHTANDQAETVILNMVRGAGVRGLAGIPTKRKLGSAYIIRPWLEVAKVEIIQYLEEHNIAAEYDASNDELTFRRNQVRHLVLPAIAEVWPDRSPVLALAELAGRMRELSRFVDSIAKEKLDSLYEDGGLSLDQLTSLDGFLFHTLIETWIHREFGHYGLTSQESARIARWMVAASPRMELRRGISLRKDGAILRLESDGRYPLE